MNVVSTYFENKRAPSSRHWSSGLSSCSAMFCLGSRVPWPRMGCPPGTRRLAATFACLALDPLCNPPPCRLARSTCPMCHRDIYRFIVASIARASTALTCLSCHGKTRASVTNPRFPCHWCSADADVVQCPHLRSSFFTSLLLISPTRRSRAECRMQQPFGTS